MDKYTFKSMVMDTNICKIVKQYDLLNKSVDFLKYINIEHQYANVLSKYGKAYIKEARRINNANYHRVTRLRDRITSYLSMGKCIWLTLTFKPSVLDSTNKETRRKYVIRFLKSQSDYYIANIDFGKKKGREHYHAVVVSDRIDTSTWRDEIGGTKCVVIKNHLNSDVKLAKYVSKLTNHAIKKTTKQNNIIYSRVKL